MNKYTKDDHCFVLCAYKENSYLEECIKSLINQTLKTNIIIETSTPNEYINNLAIKYSIPVIVNNGENGCAQDWNFGFENAPFKLITIAHQDDIYYPDFSKEVINYANKEDNVLILYTDYDELRNEKITKTNKLLFIKRLLNNHMKNRNNWSKDIAKKRTLIFGNAISCPTVTMVKENVGNRPYDETYKCSCDYKTWVNLLSINGNFIYIPKHLMAHRIYKESHTTIYLQNSIRQKEDAEILSSFWPCPINKIVYKLYSHSQKNNEL